MSYAGNLSPHEAWAKLGTGAILVDVRTEGEWANIGVPDTTTAGGRRNDPLFIQWNLAGGVPNPHFVEQLRRQASEDTAVELVFLCRSGARSAAAATAAAAAGYTAYNVLEGFEGAPDRFGERTVNGWKNRGLPTNRGKI
jgi:rhodanese-related sulfurtransferase